MKNFLLIVALLFSLPTLNAVGGIVVPPESDKQIQNRFTEDYQRWFLEVDRNFRIHSNMDVRYSQFRFPLEFYGPIYWSARTRSYETTAEFFSREGCRYRAFVELTLLNVAKDVYELDVTLRAPARIDSFCRAEGQAAARFTFRKESMTEEVLIDALRYKGGFEKESMVTVKESRVATQIRLAVPKFCKGVEILKVVAEGNGMISKLTLIDRTNQVYAVGNNGMAIRNLKLDLNGPVGMACEIPVYGTFVTP